MRGLMGAAQTTCAQDGHSRKSASLFEIVLDSCEQFRTRQTEIWAATWQNQQSDSAPSEDSDQPGHPPSLIRVFAVRLMGSFLHADSEDSDQTGRMPRLIWVFAGRTLILLVFSCRGSLDYTST